MSVSVVLAVLDAAEVVAGAIESALGQSYDGALEVIVAHGPSTDDTAAVLAGFGGRITVVPNPTGGRSSGLNAAIAAASGTVIVRCDAQARLPADYVATAVALLDETGADVVGGIQDAQGITPTERAIAIAQSTPLGVGDARYRTAGAPGDVDTVYLGVFRREALARVGGFDETLAINEDYDTYWRIRETGGRIRFDPSLRVAYRPRSSFSDLWTQYFRYGTWKREMLRRHPRSLRWRQLAAPFLVAGLGASAVVAGFGSRPIGAILPAVYLAVLLGAAAVLPITRRDPAALRVPIAIATMHVAWGLGFLVGRP
ncbi:MAG TPA: glycosyltransferase family 2 protein [Acidimicrobiia bacterium]|nr:glycosyltransferase family 2 protein [Acidimicrobiia bacterium]